MERKVEVAKRYAPKGQRAAFLAEIAFSRAVGATKQLRAECMRLLLFALAAVASAQLEHSVGEALSWKSLRRAALGDKGAEQLEETLEIGGASARGPPKCGGAARRRVWRGRRRSDCNDARARPLPGVGFLDGRWALSCDRSADGAPFASSEFYFGKALKAICRKVPGQQPPYGALQPAPKSHNVQCVTTRAHS